MCFSNALYVAVPGDAQATPEATLCAELLCTTTAQTAFVSGPCMDGAFSASRKRRFSESVERDFVVDSKMWRDALKSRSNAANHFCAMSLIAMRLSNCKFSSPCSLR